MDSRLLTTKPKAKPQKEVVIKIKITDDTATPFDRDAFMKAIESNEIVKASEKAPESGESEEETAELDEDKLIDKIMTELGREEINLLTFRQFFALLKEKGVSETYVDMNRGNIKRKKEKMLEEPEPKKTKREKQKKELEKSEAPEPVPVPEPDEPVPVPEPAEPKALQKKYLEKDMKEPPEWYMNDRSKFIEFINEHFKMFKESIDKEEPVMCSTLLSKEDFILLSHQNIVKDYLNLYSPYRGLLLYHGLGSGKTCSSIAIAEGLKNKLVMVLTPASLEKNYMQELKKCGDQLYKFNKNWVKETYTDELARENSLPKKFAALASKQGGIWMENPTDAPNYDTLSAKEKEQIEAQIDILIKEKYTFLHYNGNLKISNGMFDNKVVIVDEAHDLVLSISNQLGSKADHKTLRLYEALMSAKNCRIVLLSGTPIVNFPNEIAVMFNIIRGFIKTWTITLGIDTNTTINLEYLSDLFLKDKVVGGTIDYINYEASSKLLTITRNPPGFKNVSNKKVTYVDSKDMSDEEFIGHVKSALQSIKGIKFSEPKMYNFRALPDKKEDFDKMFIDEATGDIEEKQIPKFKRRILGLTSFFPDLTRLMPKYDGIMKLEERPMSDYQLIEYQKIRKEEIATEKTRAQNRQRFGEEESSSTYRNASRQACNFVFPEEIERPKPDKQKLDKHEKPDEENDEDEQDDVIYEAKKKKALGELFQGDYLIATAKLLGIYSPKFLNIYENITTQKGLHLVYSHYREMEGIAILKLVLLKNKFQEFKLKKNRRGEWSVDDSVKPNVPCFVSYGGQTDKEEKEILRNIYNSDWTNLPPSITNFFKGHDNNHYGDVIKVFMITASGSQGISLKNVQFVHLTEPFWHLVRLEQVIGRARRICSHESLPVDKQKITVYLYMMRFDLKKKLDATIKDRDISKRDKKSIFTTDQSIYETALIKETIKNKFLKMIKETAIDCSIHSEEDLQCYSISNPSPNKYSYVPDVTEEDSTFVKEVKVTYLPIKISFGELKGRAGLIMNPKVMKDANEDEYTNVYELKQPNNSTTLIARLYKKKKRADGTIGVVVETV